MAQKGDVVVLNDFRGINVEDQPFIIDDTNCQLAFNVIVQDKAVEIRGGYELFAEDNTRTGGVTMMERFYQRDGTKQLVFANDGEYFYVTPSNQTWQSIGSMGATPTLNPTAFQYENILLFGTGEVGNTTQYWDGTTLANVPTPPATDDVRFFESYQGMDVRFLCAAGVTTDSAGDNITTLYYTPDPLDWATAPAGNLQVGPSDGQDITGLATQDQLVVYKEKSKYYLGSFYEENSGLFALRLFGQDNSSGAPTHETLIKEDGDIITITQKGKSIEGYGREGTAQGNARPKQYATYINPILNGLTWENDKMLAARSEKFDRYLLYSVPFNGSPTNNVTLFGYLDTPTDNTQPSWTTSNIRAGSWAVFQDEDGVDQLYFGDALQPRIYRYTPDLYSDNGFEYTRIWRSKRFNLNSRADWDGFNHVIITGSIKTITELTLNVFVDGKKQTYIIDKNQIIETGTSTGAYIGDRFIGDETIGGNPTETDKFRFLAVAFIPNSLRYAHEIEIELRNSGIGQFWRVDYLSLNEPVNIENIPANHKNLRSA